ncbi:DUF4224 domain-containing protein [Burkholderia multivorans]|uniref:DUF4224 domain-containing protein n=1 Tax=Burkholderia multivorans TaxID=87883 RepID=UPI001C27DF7A|nr:DUF4224 domain-containing protein [Burkholderia multivorans]MBU9484628.1 DUF4224 domain-containing protein [Burkholderia multivorans]
MQTTCPRVVLRPIPSHGVDNADHPEPAHPAALTLSAHEIYEATGYRQPARQLRALTLAGIPADRRPDGSVRVWRHHVLGFAAHEKKTKRKRPKLTSDMKDTTK